MGKDKLDAQFVNSPNLTDEQLPTISDGHALPASSVPPVNRPREDSGTLFKRRAAP